MALDFFASIGDIKKYVKGFTADEQIDGLNPVFRPSKQRVVNIIGLDTYNQILAYYNDPDPVDDILAQAVDFISGALANIMFIPWFFDESGERNNTDNNLYRYQEDKIIEITIDRYWTELNYLIELLDANIAKFTDYPNTDTYKDRENLFFKNAYEFDRWYSISKSAYFFNITIPIQR